MYLESWSPAGINSKLIHVTLGSLETDFETKSSVQNAYQGVLLEIDMSGNKESRARLKGYCKAVQPRYQLIIHRALQLEWPSTVVPNLSREPSLHHPIFLSFLKR